MSSGVKRKTLDDFFTAAEPRTKRHHLDGGTNQEDRSCCLHEQSLDQPRGLSIIHDFVTPEEEEKLVAFLDEQAWRTDLSRRCMHYGGTYCLMPPKGCSPEIKAMIEATTYDAPPVPSELDFIVGRMVTCGLYGTALRPAYCIVNEYKPALGISAHVENFRFGEPVCSLTLAGADTMRFHELKGAHDGSVRSGRAASAPRTGRRSDISMPRRSLLVLRGDARSSWQHEIVRGRKSSKPVGWRRVSLTFRVDKKPDAGGKHPRTSTSESGREHEE